MVHWVNFYILNVLHVKHTLYIYIYMCVIYIYTCVCVFQACRSPPPIGMCLGWSDGPWPGSWIPKVSVLQTVYFCFRTLQPYLICTTFTSHRWNCHLSLKWHLGDIQYMQPKRVGCQAAPHLDPIHIRDIREMYWSWLMHVMPIDLYEPLRVQSNHKVWGRLMQM